MNFRVGFIALLFIFSCAHSSAFAQTQCGPKLTSGGELRGRVLYGAEGLQFTLAGASVTILAFDKETRANNMVAEAQTDERGRFSLSGLKAGEYTGIAEYGWRLRIDFAVTVDTDRKTPGGEVEITLGSEWEKSCFGGFVRQVKTFSDEKVVGALASQFAEGISEISLERKGCFGSCPIYKVTLKRDGSVVYVGKDFVKRRGTFRGKLHGYYFNQLAELMYRQGFFNLKERYSAPVTDQDTVITSVVRDGKLTSVQNYGGEAPVELWGIESAIDAVVEQVTWESRAKTRAGNR